MSGASLEAAGGWKERGVAARELPTLTTVLFIAAIRTVLKPVAAEAADDAVDAAGAGEERRAALRFSLGCRGRHRTNSKTAAG